ncbi:MAG: hypothetical protein ACRDRL_10665 [Sciscionella sp.]
MRTEESRPSGTTGAAPTEQIIADNDSIHVELTANRRQLPTARAELYMPGGRRRQWAALVACCPRCHHAHLHRAERWHDLAGEIRTGSCGRSYRLHVVALSLVDGAL